MSISDTAGLLISVFALAVAFYGIFERQRAAYSSLRVRITELLAEAEALNIEEDKYLDAQSGENVVGERPRTDFALGSITARRALLTYQALALVHRLTRVRRRLFGDLSLTPSEHGSLAMSLMRSADLSSAREQWDAALASREETTDSVRAANHAGSAQCLFALDQIKEGRAHYQRSIELRPKTEVGQQLAFETCLDWLDREKDVEGDTAGQALPVKVARSVLEGAEGLWVDEAMERLRANATQTIYLAKQGEYAEWVAGFEELPEGFEESSGAVAGSGAR